LKILSKVAIVDDHEFFRYGVAQTIKRFSFVELAFAAINGKDFIEKQAANPADLVLLDIDMPQMDGYEVVIESRKLFPELKIVIFSGSDEDETFRKFLGAGISGYLTKTIDQKGLETALKAIIDGKNYYSQELMSYFTRELTQTFNVAPNHARLTSRELEILQLIFDGLSNKEIADKLFISIRTVTNHRFNIKAKTSTKNTAGLISYGLKNKLLK